MYTCDKSGITNKSNTCVLQVHVQVWQTYLWYTVMTDLPLIYRYDRLTFNMERIGRCRCRYDGVMECLNF